MTMGSDFIEKSTTADSVFQYLHDRIVSGQMKSGEVLPSQDILAKRLNVSRNTVREAVFRLSALGLVKAKQGVGTLVLPSTPSRYIGSLPDHLMLDKITMTEFLEARLFTERHIVKLVVIRATDEHLGRLRTILKKQAEAISFARNSEFNRQDLAFHMELGHACGNSVMLKLFQSIWDLLAQFTSESYRIPGNIEKAYRRHCNIYNAIVARDVEAGRRQIEAHIREIVESTADYLKLDLDVQLLFDTILAG